MVVVMVWPAAVRRTDSGSAGQRVGVSVARVSSKLGEPCFTGSRGIVELMKRVDASRAWRDAEGEWQGEWVVTKVAARAKKGLRRPSWGGRFPRSYWAGIVANVFSLYSDTPKRRRAHGPQSR